MAEEAANGGPPVAFDVDVPAPAAAQVPAERRRTSLLDFEPGMSQVHRKSVGTGATSGGARRTTVVVNQAGRTSTLSTAMNLITVMVGAGVLGFPKAFSNAGWVAGPLVLLASGLATLETGFLTVEALVLAEERLKQGATFSFSRPESFEDLAEAAFGQNGKVIAGVTLNVFMICLCTAFMILIGSSLTFLTCELLPYWVWVISVSVFFAGLGLLKDMAVLSRLSMIGVAASITYVLAIAQAGIQAGMENRGSPDFKERSYPRDPGDLGGVVAVMVLGFGYHIVVPTVRAEMAAPQEMSRAVQLAVLVAMTVYGGVGALGYSGWGDAVHGNVLESMVTPEGSRMLAGVVLSIAVVANLFVTFPIVMNVVAVAVEGHVAGGYSPPVRLALLAVTVLVSLVCPLFLEILSLMGSTVGAISVVFLPLAVYWKLLLSSDRPPPSRLLYVKHALVAIIGAAALIFGTVGAMSDLVAALSPAPAPAGGETADLSVDHLLAG